MKTMNSRDQAFKFTQQQIKRDAKNARLVDKIVNRESKAFLVWWDLFQEKYPDYEQSDGINYPDAELLNELNQYAVDNNLRPQTVSNVDQMIDYAAMVYTSVIADKSINLIGKELKNDAKLTAAFTEKVYKKATDVVGSDIINKAYDGAKWSERIWSHQAQLRSDIAAEMRKALIMSNNPISAVKTIKDKYGVYRYQAERILRTEGARVSASQQARGIKASGYDRMEWISSVGACRYCLDMDGKKFDADKFGDPPYVIPKHPNCRCAVVAVGDPSKTLFDD